MSGLIIFSVLGIVITGAGLYNLGVKARRLEETDEDFFERELAQARSECYNISKKYSRQLAKERRRYIKDSSKNNQGYNEWMTQGVKSFFFSRVSPRLIDAHREYLVRFGIYPEIIDQVAASAVIDERDHFQVN